MSIYRDELMKMFGHMTKDELTNYIERLEARVKETSSLISELKQMRKRMSTKVLDNGPRTGG